MFSSSYWKSKQACRCNWSTSSTQRIFFCCLQTALSDAQWTLVASFLWLVRTDSISPSGAGLAAGNCCTGTDAWNPIRMSLSNIMTAAFSSERWFSWVMQSYARVWDGTRIKAPWIHSKGHPSSWALSAWGEGGEGVVRVSLDTVALITSVTTMCIEFDTIIGQYCSCLVTKLAIFYWNTHGIMARLMMTWKMSWWLADKRPRVFYLCQHEGSDTLHRKSSAYEKYLGFTRKYFGTAFQDNLGNSTEKKYFPD